MITPPGTTDSKIIGASTVSPAIVSVTVLTTVMTDDRVHVDDELVSQVVTLVVAEERGLAAEVDLMLLASTHTESTNEIREGGVTYQTVSTLVVPTLRIRIVSQLPVGFVQLTKVD